jgi:MFS family permease
MRLTDFHAMPLCTPSRAQLLTGRLAPRHGVCSNFAQESLFGLNQSELTLAAFLLGMAAGQLVHGPLSDRLGRRLPLFLGMGGFVLASIGCALAGSAEALTWLYAAWAVPPAAAAAAAAAAQLAWQGGGAGRGSAA